MVEGQGRDNLLNSLCYELGQRLAAHLLPEEDEPKLRARLKEAALESGLSEEVVQEKLDRVVEEGKDNPANLAELLATLDGGLHREATQRGAMGHVECAFP
jgi:hypothetical protein